MTTDVRFVKNVNRLIEVKKPQASSLLEVKSEPIAASRGIGEANTPPKPDASGGISSPLKEIPNTREYHEPELIKSSDGLFVIESQSIKSAHFKDANGERIILEFAPT